MKKYFFIASILFGFLGYSQGNVAQKIKQLENSRVSFQSFSLFTPQNTTNLEIEKIVSNATLVEINTQKLNQIVQEQKDFIQLEIPYNNQTAVVKLYKVNPFSEDFHVDTNKEKNIFYEKGLYYRGIVENDYSSVVSFNFFKDECNGIISSQPLSNLVVGKLRTQNNLKDYIIYADEKLKIMNEFECHTKDIDSIITKSNDKNSLSARCVTFYFEIDYDIFTSNGSSTTTTTNWMTSVFNNVQTLYNNDGITTALKSMYIWTTQDPYEGVGSSSSNYLYAFNAQRPVFDGDVGQLVGIDPGGLGGVAVTIGGVCSSDNFSYSDVTINYSTVPTYSWTVQVITHEFGHLLGSPHTHACVWNGNNTAIDNCAPQALGSSWEGGSCMTSPPTIPSSTVKGTIMSYCHLISGVGISFNNGFGVQPRNRILSEVNGGNCLSTNCVNTCINTVSEVSLLNTTATTAQISWNDLGSTTAWQVSVYSFGGSPIFWTTVNSNTYTFSGLLENTYYVAAVRPLCSAGLVSTGRNIIFVTSANFCSGVNFYDTGGASNNYGDMQTVVRTMIPNLPSNNIVLTFNSFEFELDYDYLYVYDGNSTAATLLGQFTGSTIPGPFTSSAPDGSLTVKYTSDQYLNYSGFSATISCSPNLNVNNSNQLIDFSYYPNPSNGIVSIISKTPFNNLRIYSVTGQLLYANNETKTATNIDISSFSNGTYFFKMNFDDKEVNFKIIKN